jgi:2'-5' RNA ligase
LHLTLKFIGEVAPEKVECIRKTLSAVRSEQGVALQFRGLGFFPNEKRPRVFWVSMDCSPNLKLLASNIEGVLEKLGIPREQRLFVPHLTLARFDPPGISEKLRAAVHENIARDFGAMQTSEFHLIESKLKPTGAEYTTLQSFPFVVAEA